MNIYLILIIQVLIASGTHIVAKTVVTDVDPVTLTFIRGVISTIALAGIFFVREKRIKIHKKDWPALLWLSFICIPVNQFLYLYGIKYTLAANGALLYATTPALVLLLSRILLNERLTTRKITGVGLAFIGVVIVIFEKGINLSSEYTYGNVIIFIAVIAWAMYTLQGKKLIVQYGAFHISSLSMIGGTILYIPIGVFGMAHFDFTTLSIIDWEGILYLGLGTSVIGYLLWYYAIGKIDTVKVSVFSNAQPIVTASFSVLFLHQTISGHFVVGGIITLVGVILTQMK